MLVSPEFFRPRALWCSCLSGPPARLVPWSSPAASSLPVDVRTKVQAVAGVTAARVRIVWDPPWSKDRMSDEAKLELGLFG